MGYKNIEDNRAYHRQYMKERRQWYKEHHCCTECGKQDARTLIGKRCCFDCLEKRTGKTCGISENLLKTKSQRVWQKHEIPKSEYYANGLCALCGQHPFITGKKVCQICYDKICAAAWKGRKAQGIRKITLPYVNTKKAWEAYQYCLDHRQEYIERWNAEYGCEKYEDRASNKK